MKICKIRWFLRINMNSAQQKKRNFHTKIKFLNQNHHLNSSHLYSSNKSWSHVHELPQINVRHSKNCTACTLGSETRGTLWHHLSTSSSTWVYRWSLSKYANHWDANCNLTCLRRTFSRFRIDAFRSSRFSECYLGHKSRLKVFENILTCPWLVRRGFRRQVASKLHRCSTLGERMRGWIGQVHVATWRGRLKSLGLGRKFEKIYWKDKKSRNF